MASKAELKRQRLIMREARILMQNMNSPLNLTSDAENLKLQSTNSVIEENTVSKNVDFQVPKIVVSAENITSAHIPASDSVDSLNTDPLNYVSDPSSSLPLIHMEQSITPKRPRVHFEGKSPKSSDLPSKKAKSRNNTKNSERRKTSELSNKSTEKVQSPILGLSAQPLSLVTSGQRKVVRKKMIPRAVAKSSADKNVGTKAVEQMTPEFVSKMSGFEVPTIELEGDYYRQVMDIGIKAFHDKKAKVGEALHEAFGSDIEDSEVREIPLKSVVLIFSPKLLNKSLNKLLDLFLQTFKIRKLLRL